MFLPMVPPSDHPSEINQICNVRFSCNPEDMTLQDVLQELANLLSSSSGQSFAPSSSSTSM